jgi:hypothetical protein
MSGSAPCQSGYSASGFVRSGSLPDRVTLLTVPPFHRSAKPVLPDALPLAAGVDATVRRSGGNRGHRRRFDPIGRLAPLATAGIGIFYAARGHRPTRSDTTYWSLTRSAPSCLSTPGTPVPLADAGGIGYITWPSHPKGFTNTSATAAEYREERR